jgi:Mn-dependent DtxR family transcriptional regulator
MKKTTEDYLKTILLLREREGSVRSIALAEAFGVSKPTVCKIVKGLLSEGYITKNGSNEIALTEKGEKLANETLQRNLTIRRFLMHCGVDRTVAEADACKMEHILSVQSLQAMAALSGDGVSFGSH